MKSGKVIINDELAENRIKVASVDVVLGDVKNNDEFIYIAFNNMRGIISTTDKKSLYSIVDYNNCKER